MHKRKHIKTPCIILGTNELLEGNDLHLVLHISETDTGPYKQDFCQGGKRAEGPYIFKYEATFILPYIFKVQ